MPHIDLLTRGYRLHRDGRADAAAEHYRRALATQPQSADSWHLLALLQRSAGEVAAALRSIRRARRLDAALPGLADNEANLMKTALRTIIQCCEDGRPHDGLETAVEAVRLDPLAVQAWRALVQVACDCGRIDLTIEAHRRIALLEPWDTVNANDLGVRLSAAGQREAAIAAVRRGLAVDPDNTVLQRTLGYCQSPDGTYVPLLQRLHGHLRPRTYLEIGVFEGKTLRLPEPGTLAIGVDPEPRIAAPLPSGTTVHALTSDAYFADPACAALLAERRIDFAFIDGLHTFEQTLRDFINVERFATRDTVVVLHDTYPIDAPCAARPPVPPTTGLWAGDCWKAVLALKAFRPDLLVRTVPVRPTGVTIITGLDPRSTVLDERFDAIVERYLPLPYEFLLGGEADLLNLMDNDWDAIRALLPRGAATAAS